MKRYDFREIYDNPFDWILYLMFCFFTMGGFYYYMSWEQFIDRGSLCRFIDRDNNLPLAKKEILNNVSDLEINKKNRSKIFDKIEYLKNSNKGFILIISTTNYDRNIEIIRKGRIELSEKLYQ